MHIRQIYVYKYAANGRPCYVGSAKDFLKRDREHCSGRLQFDRHLRHVGRACFVLELVEEVVGASEDEVCNRAVDRELHWMLSLGTFRTEGCFNFALPNARPDAAAHRAATKASHNAPDYVAKRSLIAKQQMANVKPGQWKDVVIKSPKWKAMGFARKIVSKVACKAAIKHAGEEVSAYVPHYVALFLAQKEKRIQRMKQNKLAQKNQQHTSDLRASKFTALDAFACEKYKTELREKAKTKKVLPISLREKVRLNGGARAYVKAHLSTLPRT